MQQVIFQSGYKGREVRLGQLVELYRNLNVKGMFSVRSRDKAHDFGKVLGHFSRVIIDIKDIDKCIKISLSGQNRVRLEQKKNVHATIAGRVVNINEFDIPKNWRLSEIYYCPYTQDTFIELKTGQSWKPEGFQFVLFENNKAYAVSTD